MEFFSLCRSSAFAKPFDKALLLTLLEIVEAYCEVIYAERQFGLIFEVPIYSVQPVAREGLIMKCIYLNCSCSDKAKEWLGDGYYYLDMLKTVFLCPNSTEVNQFPDGKSKQIFIKKSSTYFTSIFPFQIYIFLWIFSSNYI